MGEFAKRIAARWNKVWEQHFNKNNKVKTLLNSDNLVLFFSHKGNLYGAGESARVTFAKLKDKKDCDNTPEWRKEATFTAADLCKLVNDNQTQTVFGNKDLDDIKVITDKDKLTSMLKQATKL